MRLADITDTKTLQVNLNVSNQSWNSDEGLKDSQGIRETSVTIKVPLHMSANHC